MLVQAGRQAFTETFGTFYHPADLAAFLDKDYDPGTISASLAGSQDVWLIAEASGQLAGFVKLGLCKLPLPALRTPQMELHRLYVLQSHQQRGVGRQLMDSAMAYFMEAGAGEICLGVWEKNPRAIAFYRAYGFEKAGEYDYPVGRQIDCEWIMRRLLV